MNNLKNFRSESYSADFDMTVEGFHVTGNVSASRDLNITDLNGQIFVGEGEQPVTFNCYRRGENLRTNICNIDITDVTDIVAVINGTIEAVDADVKAAAGGE